MQLAGKRAIVTGAASGIGRGIATVLASRGARVMASDVSVEAGTAFAAATEGVEFQRADVSREEEIVALVDGAVAAFGGLDIMVNNAGIPGPFYGIEIYPTEDFDRVMAVMLRGAFLGTKHAAVAMMRAGIEGAIINISSNSAGSGGNAAAAYSMAKAGIRSLTQCAAVEFAPWRIRVNSVAPGPTATGMTPTRDPQELRRMLAGAIPWPDAATPEDIGTVVAFLTSEDARMVTGEMIVADGGVVAAGARLIMGMLQRGETPPES